MARRSELEKTRVHVMLFKEDVDFLDEEYGKNSPKPIGLSAAVSMIIHAKVQDLRARAAEEYERMSRAKERAG